MNLKEIQTIIRNFEKSDLTYLELETEGFKIKLSKNRQDPETPKTETKTEPGESPAAPEKPEGYAVRSPLVGTFYAAPAPGEKPFVAVGDRVEAGQTLCIIEAMKIMNEITAPVSGVIASINVENGAFVGYDQVLMVIA
jgi:acetyl-CoA carboxylase biotin carboxyl carrier protein